MTPDQRQLLDVARELIAVAEVSPTVPQMARYVDRPVRSARRDVEALIAGGHLRRGEGRPFGLRLPPLPDLSHVPDGALAGELARRGKTLASLEPRAPSAVGYQRTCAADSCGVAVRRGHLMCREHWFALSPELRTRILRTNAARDRGGFERAVTQARDLIDSGKWRARA